MMQVHRVTNLEQLNILADELRDTLLEMEPELTRTVDKAWEDISHYFEQYPYAAIWVVFENSRLLAWSAAKVYVDLPSTTTVAVTWAWAATGAKDAPRRLHETICAWARERGASSLYAARRSRLDAYARWIARYGSRFDRVVFVHDLTTEASDELRTRGEQSTVADPGSASSPRPASADALRCDDAGAPRADAETPGSGDSGAARSSHLESPEWRLRTRVWRERHGLPAAGAGGPVTTGTRGVRAGELSTRGEPAGCPEPRDVGSAAPGGVEGTVHPVGGGHRRDRHSPRAKRHQGHEQDSKPNRTTRGKEGVPRGHGKACPTPAGEAAHQGEN